MIVTLDGPAGAGKSSAAKALSGRLGFEFLDTGAMYRAVTWAALRARLDLRDQVAIADLLSKLRLELPPARVVLNGEDVTGVIRTLEVTNASGTIADSPVVRRQLVDLQRAFASGRDVVSEGRDQGTVVFPGADCKFFLVADPTERARRRQREHVSLEEVLRAQEERDRRDAARDLAPMIPARDALVVDTTGLSLEQVVDRLEEEVRRAQARHRAL